MNLPDCFSEREIAKSTSFAELVGPYFGSYFSKRAFRLIDICAGNGVATFGFQRDYLIAHSTLIDIKMPKSFPLKAKRIFDKKGLNYSYLVADIMQEDFSLNPLCTENTALVAIHPCSELADRVIQLGIEVNIPFALMTCCHKREIPRYDLKDAPDPRLMLYDKKEDYVDLLRQRYIAECGRVSVLKKIPSEITPMNNVLIGI